MRVDTINGFSQATGVTGETLIISTVTDDESQNAEHEIGNSYGTNGETFPPRFFPFRKVGLGHVVGWNFDIFLLEQIEKRPLTWLGKKIFAIFDATNVLGIEETVLDNWLNMIEANYHAENPYHNAIHAADVLQATAFYLNTPRMKKMLEPLEHVSCLVAATVHDVDHPGKNNAFLMNSNDDLALLYNDKAILESHHSAVAFKLTIKDPEVNIFGKLDRDTYRRVRESIVDMVLATEMAQHKIHVSNFVRISQNSAQNGETKTALDTKGDNLAFVKRILIKCADVSNPARPLKTSIQWTKRISEEYFRQTEIETARGLPQALPMYERSTCSIPTAQLGFFDSFITELYESWHAYVQLPELVRQFKANYDFWKNLEKKQIKSVEELDSYLRSHPIGEND